MDEQLINALYLFAATFASVFALGFQSQNVNQGHYFWAGVTSLVIGGSTMWLYKYMPDASVLGQFAYLAGGVAGILASMVAHRRWLGPRKT